MTTISDFLASLNLGQYQNRFLLEGISNVSDLLSLSDPELESRLASYGLLKGHIFKLRHAVEQLRGRSPQKSVPPPTPEQTASPTKSVLHTAPSPGPTDVLLSHTNKLTAKLAEIDQLKTALSKSKATILELDVSKYRTVLDQIEALQQAFSGRDDRVPAALPQTDIEMSPPSEPQ